MSILRKLSRLPGLSRPTPSEPEGEGRWDAFDAALRSEAPSRRSDVSFALPGELETTMHGPLHRIARALDEEHRHGDVTVAAVRDLEPVWLARFGLDDALAGIDLSGLLFLDTETTGLAGGTGTVPFLVGMAWFDEKRLHVEQLFLRRLGEEAPMLHRLTERLHRSSCLVTYNGKSFDWPLLRTRYVMNRVPLPRAPLHLDLLHATRRLLRMRLSSVRLVDVERALLGHARHGDVDGARIPEIYLAYHRDGHHPELPIVLHHNELDLVAMPAILARLAARFGDADPSADALDRFACALVAERAGDHALAERFASLAASAMAGDDGARAHLLRGRIARRRGAHDDEEAALLAALDAAVDATFASSIHLRLAKLYEHRLRLLDLALEHARHTTRAEGEEASTGRAARIARKLEARGVLVEAHERPR